MRFVANFPPVRELGKKEVCILRSDGLLLRQNIAKCSIFAQIILECNLIQIKGGCRRIYLRRSVKGVVYVQF